MCKNISYRYGQIICKVLHGMSIDYMPGCNTILEIFTNYLSSLLGGIIYSCMYNVLCLPAGGTACN